MFDPQRPSGAGFGGASTTPANPFGQLQSTHSPAVNPFASGTGSSPAANPFAQVQTTAAPTANPFSSQARPSNPFGLNGGSRASPQTSALGTTSATKSSPFGAAVFQTSTNGAPSQPIVQATWPAVKQATGKRKGDADGQSQSKFSRNSPDPQVASNRHTSATRGGRGGRVHQGSIGLRQPRPPSRPVTSKDSDLAVKVHAALAKDNIRPPQWPENPGSSGQRKSAENFREAYNTYRENARKCLIKANLIDDPDKRRALSDALEFKGICEGMCPDWERITRIIQHDVKREEREDVNGESQANIELMVTRHARSSAGQDAPLPMDVRSPGALRRTLNYMIDELIPEDHLLPARHNFLWDRTRAIRKDFIYQEYAMGRDEMKDYIYCLETIARFHVTALHLLTQPDFASKDFSAQQENEQLEKTLISLMQAYDDCAKQSIECPNEAEFRSYYIIVMADNPAWMDVVQSFAARFWNDSDSIRTASIIVESLKNVWDMQGPLMPPGTSEMALPMISTFFDIVASPAISYTMACFAEIHFPKVRRLLLKILREAYWRPKAGPTDLTPAVIQRKLRLDSEEEAIEFAKSQGFVFGVVNGQTYAINNARQALSEDKPLRMFSRSIVERKRGDHSLAEVIYTTFYEEAPSNDDQHTVESESLFVDGSQDAVHESNNQSASDSNAPSVASSHPPSSASPSPASDDPQLKYNATPQSPLPAFMQATPSSISEGSNLFSTPSLPPQTTKSSSPTSSWFPKPQPVDNPAAFQLPASSSDTSAVSTNGEQKATIEPAKPVSDPGTAKSSPFSFLAGQKPLSSPASALFGPKSTEPSQPDKPASTVLPAASSSTTSGFVFPTSTNGMNSSPQPTSNTTPKPSPVAVPDMASQPPAVSPKPDFFATGLGNSMSAKTPQKKSSISVEPQRSPFAATKSKDPSGEPEKAIQHVDPEPDERDPMDSLTRWFVCADRGLMEEHLEQWTIENILQEVWNGFVEAEEERIRKEEDDKSWAEARKFREYSLSVTYFYRWLDNFRKRRAVKRIQLEKEKARQWNTPENRAKRAAAAKAEEEKALRESRKLLAQKTAKRPAEYSPQLAQSIGSERRPRRDSLEEALLAPAKEAFVSSDSHASRTSSKDVQNPNTDEPLPGEKNLLRFENQRRKKRGLQPLRKYPEPKTYKEGSKSAMLKALSSGSGRDSMSLSTTSLRNSTFSSSYRSSLGFNGLRISKPTSKVSDPYWRLKANGLVQMPNGEYLHESLAIPMLEEGRRFPGIGDYGISASGSRASMSQSPARSIDIPDEFSPPPPPERVASGDSLLFRKPSRVSLSPAAATAGSRHSSSQYYTHRQSSHHLLPRGYRKRGYDDMDNRDDDQDEVNGDDYDGLDGRGLATRGNSSLNDLLDPSDRRRHREGSSTGSLHKRARSSVRGVGDGAGGGDVHSVSSDSDFLASIDRLLKDVQDAGKSLS